MEPHGLSKHSAFHVSPFAGQVINSITMVVLYNILADRDTKSTALPFYLANPYNSILSLSITCQ
jgi:hypothetical protein